MLFMEVSVIDHEIPLEADQKLPMGQMYSMSPIESQEIRTWIEEILNQIWGAKYFTRLRIQSEYNLIRIKEGD